MSSPAPVNGAPASRPSSPWRPTGGLTFRAPEADETTSTTGAPAGEETAPSLDDLPAGSPSDSEWSSADPEDDENDPRSSKGSSGSESVRPLSARAQKAAARQAVKIAGSMAHQYLARDAAAQAVGLYLVDDETAEQIGDPLARIAARHAGPTGAIANPDVADGIAAMLGVAKFVSITIEKGSQAAALRMGPTLTPVGD
jgi:hypothetical protein